MTEFVRAEIAGRAGRLTLERPAALNALDLPMFLAVEQTLASWADDPRVELVVARGNGRAFSAGGDIRAVREAVLRGDRAYLDALYRSEYDADGDISEYRKPYVALIDGYCMGGGMGLAIHGSHRVVTENALLAMPETAIGFFPDVGCTYVLPRLAGRVGWYLGLSGYRMRAADALWCGLATHHVEAASLAACERELVETEAPVDAVLARYAAVPPASALAERAADIARCFEGPSVADVFAALEAAGGEWAGETLATLRQMSPTALVATWALFEEGAAMTLRQCLEMEFLACRRMLAGHDFAEGVRAVVVDKDRNPRWAPERLEDVDAPAVRDAMRACAREAVGVGVPDSAPDS